MPERFMMIIPKFQMFFSTQRSFIKECCPPPLNKSYSVFLNRQDKEIMSTWVMHSFLLKFIQTLKTAESLRCLALWSHFWGRIFQP